MDDEEEDGPEEEEEASEPEMRSAKRKRVPVPRPIAGTPAKLESMEEVEQRLQPGSVKHAIFQVQAMSVQIWIPGVWLHGHLTCMCTSLFISSIERLQLIGISLFHSNAF